MELKAFIDSALRQIIERVVSAQGHAAQIGGAVNPPIRSSVREMPDVMGTTAGDVQVLKVTFDVAVTVVESSDSKAGGSLKVPGVISVGGGGSLGERSEKVSRLQFIVPLALPDDVKTREGLDKEQAERDAGRAKERAKPVGHRRGGY